MLAGIRFEQFSKVWTAGGQHHLVRREAATVAGERHVDKVLFVAEVSERGQDARMEVVPAQRVLLLGARVAPHSRVYG